VKGQVLDGEQVWTFIKGLEPNDHHHYTHLLTSVISIFFIGLVMTFIFHQVNILHFFPKNF
jgi:hypothetical protein